MSEIKVTPLGTVSPYPKGNHNCPGFLLEYNKEKLLLDCGSGTSRLLSMEEDLKNLSIIISHNHLDHYSDLTAIAYASYCYHNLGLINKRVKVYSRDINFEYLGNTHYLEFHNIMDNFNSAKLSYLKNIHDTPCYSTKITTKEGLTIVYTADTGYNEELIEFSKNADLLICESTFLKGQKGSKNHLYAFEAGQIAKLANVKNLMLNHFWPEISSEEYINEASVYFENIIGAEEGKTLTLRRN